MANTTYQSRESHGDGNGSFLFKTVYGTAVEAVETASTFS